MKAVAKTHPTYQDLRPTFQDCKIGVLQHVNNICLQIDSTHQQIWLRGHRDEIIEKLEAVLSELKPVRELAKYKDLSPKEVIEYFYQSPVLVSMAKDVELALSQFVTPEAEKSDLDIVTSKIDTDDLFFDGVPIRGAQARIAQALSVPNAGVYHKRVLKVLSQLVELNSTTTTRPVEKSRKAV